jgi:hypothetical protein
MLHGWQQAGKWAGGAELRSVVLAAVALLMDELTGPPQTRKVAGAQVLGAIVAGQHTDFVVNLYSDCAFVAITQVGKLGTVMHIREEGTLSGGRHSVQVLMGQRENNLITTYADQLAQFILPKCRTPLLLTLAMKNHEPKLDELEALLAVLAHRVKW